MSKPDTDGEFIKQCVESMAGIICHEKKGDISKISLSHQTIATRTEETGKSIQRTLESKAANFKLHASGMGDSTDATDMAQLAIFIRGIDDKYDITEEMVSLVPLKDTTK